MVPLVAAIDLYFMISKISVVKYFVGYSKFISCLCLHAVSLVTRVLL